MEEKEVNSYSDFLTSDLFIKELSEEELKDYIDCLIFTEEVYFNEKEEKVNEI